MTDYVREMLRPSDQISEDEFLCFNVVIKNIYFHFTNRSLEELLAMAKSLFSRKSFLMNSREFSTTFKSKLSNFVFRRLSQGEKKVNSLEIWLCMVCFSSIDPKIKYISWLTSSVQDARCQTERRNTRRRGQDRDSLSPSGVGEASGCALDLRVHRRDPEQGGINSSQRRSSSKRTTSCDSTSSRSSSRN